MLISNNNLLYFDSLVLQSLSALKTAVDQKKIVFKIASDLGFILNKPKVSKIDQGCARLLDLVLEDFVIKNKANLALAPISSKDPLLFEALLTTANILDILESIKNVFLLEPQRVPVILFLSGLSLVYDANNYIIKWLKWRRYAAVTIDLFILFNQITSIATLAEHSLSNSYGADLVLAYVCKCSKLRPLLSLSEASKLNFLLESNSLMGIELLLDLGFFKLSEPLPNGKLLSFMA